MGEVGAGRLELPASCSQSRRSTRLSYAPVLPEASAYRRGRRCRFPPFEGSTRSFYAAKVISMKFSRQILLVLAAASLLAAGAPAALAGTRVSAPEAGLVRAVNAARHAHGLRPLRLDATLVRAARSHSVEMMQTGAFAHGAFAGRMAAFHVRGPFVGENLAWGTGSYAQPQTIVAEWLQSPEHRRNLLRPGFTRIGIGEVQGSFLGSGGAVVVTADFAGF
jgi:uncharacterized protein YkwD